MGVAVHVGIDDGHDGIKVFFGSADGVSEPVKMHIPSKAQSSFRDIVDVPQDALDKMTIIVDSKTDGEPSAFLVDADYVTERIDTRTEDYPYNDLNLALIMQAIRGVRPALEGVTELKVVAGLPANQYYNKNMGGKNEDLVNKKIENLKTLHRAHSPADKDLPNEGRFEAHDVTIMPEGYGIAFNLMFDEDLQKTEYYEDFYNHGCVIIDIGGRTVDVVTVMPRTCKPKGSELLSFDKGVLYLREVISTTLTERYGLKRNLNENSVDAILRTGWIGRAGGSKSINVEKDVLEIKKLHVKEVYDSIKGVLDTNEALGGVILSGGGAVLLGELLRDHIDEHEHQCEIILPEDMVFGNAKGFWKMAWAKYQ